jgi:uncharacterized protein
MLIIDAEQVAPQAWRNGGGRTRELLAWPAGADWRVRVSLADIEADGPFSPFPGVQRWFAVVQGAGVVLRFSSGQQHVRAGDAPLCFDGAQAPGCALIDGPTRDLNLMHRGGRSAMRPVQRGEWWRERFDQRGLFTLSAGHWHREAGTDVPSAAGQRVEARMLLWDLGGQACRFDADGTGPCGWWLGFSGDAA